MIAMMMSFISYVSLYLGHSLEDHIDEAELIITATLYEQYSKKELLTHSAFNNESFLINADQPVLTTHVFQIQQILKGDYVKRYIEVKTLGGCDPLSNECESLGHNITFAQNQPVMLLLKHEKANNTYQMASPHCSAFLLGEGEQLSKVATIMNLDQDAYVKVRTKIHWLRCV